jgi:hypothetical protein
MAPVAKETKEASSYGINIPQGLYPIEEAISGTCPLTEGSEVSIS